MPAMLMALAAPLIGCSSDSALEKYLDKLSDCGFVTDGYVRGSEDVTAEDRCYMNCLSAGTCDEIQESRCEDDTPLEVECYERCEEIFVCDDGDEIPAHWRCDADNDCSGGEDEVGCSYFSCDDGEEIPLDWECDGYEDCENAEDEAGCSSSVLFDCGDGQTIPRNDRCDDYEDCANGADEVGCAEFDFMCI